jgi:hypothetical protein
VVSAVIVVERTEEGHALPVQRSVYYISEVMFETKARYPQIQKLLYAVVLARRKFCHYFEAHPVKPRIFIENPNPCTIAIVPGSVAIAYRTSHI